MVIIGKEESMEFKTIALGTKPRNGGNPARDIKRRNIKIAYIGEIWVKLVAVSRDAIFNW